MSKKSREPLGRQAIVEAAVAIADAQGVGALSMRSLAKSLGFEVMSLYNHVANKPELLSLMVDHVAAEIEPPTAVPGSTDGARSIAIAMRAAFVTHPWAAGLWQRYLPRAAQTQRMEELLATFNQSGLSPELAHHGFHAVNNHVLGYSLQDLELTMGGDTPESGLAAINAYLASLDEVKHPNMIAHVHQHIAGDSSSSFELVLDLILNGLVRLNGS